ncbi:hypothetical protein BD289DRAFT_434227 [Coniella lustricola]|uniref:Uncharacterized protein n=1 Tax=Coniella lustricola TaxID=2025994 RepID=A0A2T3A7L9_9PEZI|nr:hypothetical protein BD289DRAFT_434227 [Coniella lustricola]
MDKVGSVLACLVPSVLQSDVQARNARLGCRSLSWDAVTVYQPCGQWRSTTATDTGLAIFGISSLWQLTAHVDIHPSTPIIDLSCVCQNEMQ